MPQAMDNAQIARVLRQTADLMEVAGEDGFRIRSYRRAAEVAESWPEPLAGMCAEPQRLRELPGIGKTIAGHIGELVATGDLALHRELLGRYHPEMLELLQVPGLGPKTVALIWETHGAGTLDAVEALAQQGKLRELPRLGEKAEQRILRGIAARRSVAGRFRRDQAEAALDQLLGWMQPVAGLRELVPAGSWRRGRDTVGDLDLLAAGAGYPATAASAAERFLQAPWIVETLARGDDKISVRLSQGLQVDLRLLPPESFGAALQYFTGSQAHNIAMRARAQEQGLKLNEYGLFRLLPDGGVGERIAGDDEAAVYQALGLPWIPPELREDHGEFAAAAAGRLPQLIEAGDIRGDLHTHTVATDGRGTILEMAAAARARGYDYIAITDHSQALAMANGLDERRMLEHLARIRAAEQEFQRTEPGFRIFAGVEVDIRADGSLDLEDEVLRQLDVVIGSIHSHFEDSREATTARLLRAIANPSLDILGHPTGRLLLRREPYAYDYEAVVAGCRQHGVAMEINASPERLDLEATLARRAHDLGVAITINTDAHHPRHFGNLRFGLATARRAWLGAADVLNTLPAEALLRRLQRA
jgi:DNA polymerase (family 10)